MVRAPSLFVPAQSQKKMESTRNQANNADTTYQESVKNLEDARLLWEREMEILCRVGRPCPLVAE